jgi:hypothetical protein
VYAVPNAVPSVMPVAPAPIKKLRRGIDEDELARSRGESRGIFFMASSCFCPRRRAWFSLLSGVQGSAKK